METEKLDKIYLRLACNLLKTAPCLTDQKYFTNKPNCNLTFLSWQVFFNFSIFHMVTISQFSLGMAWLIIWDKQFTPNFSCTKVFCFLCLRESQNQRHISLFFSHYWGWMAVVFCSMYRDNDGARFFTWRLNDIRWCWSVGPFVYL